MKTLRTSGHGARARGLRGEMLVMLVGAVLAGCGGGGDGGSDPPGNNPPPPPPPPPTGTTVPPLSTTVVDISDNRQIGEDRWDNGATSTGGLGQDVEGLPCLLNMPDEYHVHTHLSIFLNGEALSVPGNVGIHDLGASEPNCFYPIHTHDKSGKLHIEAEAEGSFTLGQFFAIWGQSLTDTDVAGLTGMPVVVYVTDDGEVTEVTEDWGAIELTSHRLITIQVGTAIEEIPNITWDGD